MLSWTSRSRDRRTALAYFRRDLGQMAGSRAWKACLQLHWSGDLVGGEAAYADLLANEAEQSELSPEERALAYADSVLIRVKLGKRFPEKVPAWSAEGR